jgi:hypothetical protein
MTLTDIFSKTYGEDTLQCPYMDYSSLDRWQANKDLLSVFTFYNLPFVTMQSRTRCLKARFACGSPYRAVGATLHRATSHDHVLRASRDLRMSCGHFRKT